MNEKMNATNINNGTGGRDCDRAEDLVAYLYGEAGPEAANSFRRHLAACAACHDELSAFGQVRAAVGEWRADALGAAPSLDLSEAFAHAPRQQPVRTRERSAAAALREFFSLSPLWLRAGALAATLAVCALAALTLARTEVRWDADGFAFRTGVEKETITKVETVEVRVPTGHTPEQVEAAVQDRLARELADARRQWEEERRGQDSVINVDERKAAPRLEVANSTAPRRKAAAPRTARRNRQEVDEEETLPRLSDLLIGVY